MLEGKNNIALKMLNIQTRLNKKDILELFNCSNLLELGALANIKKQEVHPDSNFVTFVIDRNINYTNICSCKCKFCAFYKEKSDENAYVLDYSAIKKKLNELVSIGGTQLLLQGGLNKDLSINYYFELIENIRNDFPLLTIHAFSPPEIYFIAKNNNISCRELIQEFVHRGLSSIPGGGAEILSDNFRKTVSPNKISSEKWLNIMEIAHELGLNTTATMVFGGGETIYDIIEHLLKIRQLQDKTGKFTAFIPWTFQTKHTKMSENNVTAHDYLKILAISRLTLDNIPNIQASWVTQGQKIAQLSLMFGANDFGGTMLEENVVRSAGKKWQQISVNEIVNNIHKAGFDAAQRDTAYNIIKKFPKC